MTILVSPGHLFALARRWHQRAASRRVLAGLSARELHDIGITPSAAAFEAAKPFWKP